MKRKKFPEVQAVSDTETVYYVAAGTSLEKAKEIIAQRKECNERRKKFRRRVGAKDLVVCGLDVVAAKFKTDAPDGWIPFKGFAGSFAPSRKTSAGRKLSKEMSELHWMADDILGSMHVGWNDRLGGLCISRPHLEVIGDTFVISQHFKADAPQDALPLKRSDYWRMKEAGDGPAAVKRKK